MQYNGLSVRERRDDDSRFGGADARTEQILGVLQLCLRPLLRRHHAGSGPRGRSALRRWVAYSYQGRWDRTKLTNKSDLFSPQETSKLDFCLPETPQLKNQTS